jgi:hypothetical protein
MADNLLLREPAPGLLRLAGGSDVLSLVDRRGEAPGNATADIASRQDGGHIRETHNGNINVVTGFTSMAESLRRWRRTTFGRLATAGMIVGVTTLAASCSDADPGQHPPAAAGGVAAGGEAAGGQNGHSDRYIIGDAACYDGFAELSGAKQAECVEAFNDFTLDQVKKLSPLDQARWAMGYRDTIAGNELSSTERLPWSNVMTKEIPRNALADMLLQTHTHDIIRVAWLMQQQDAEFKAMGSDPLTWAALFGVGTEADSQPITDAKQLIADLPAGTASYETYLRSAVTRTDFFSSVATDVKAVKGEGGAYTLTFTATHNADNKETSFTYLFHPYLMQDTDSDGSTVYRELKPGTTVNITQGNPLIGAPAPTNP